MVGILKRVIIWSKINQYRGDHKYLVQKLFFMRGGRNMKVEAQSLSGDRFTYWIQILELGD